MVHPLLDLTMNQFLSSGVPLNIGPPFAGHLTVGFPKRVSPGTPATQRWNSFLTLGDW